MKKKLSLILGLSFVFVIQSFPNMENEKIRKTFFRDFIDLPLEIREALNGQEDILELYNLGIKFKEKNIQTALICFEYVVDKFDPHCWGSLDEKTALILAQSYNELNKCVQFISIFADHIDVEVEYGKNLEETYDLGLAFKKGKGPDFQNNKIKSLRAAYQCFHFIANRCVNGLNDKDKKLICYSYYQLGLLRYRYNRLLVAKNCFNIAINLGSKDAEKILFFIDAKNID